MLYLVLHSYNTRFDRYDWLNIAWNCWGLPKTRNDTYYMETVLQEANNKAILHGSTWSILYDLMDPYVLQVCCILAYIGYIVSFVQGVCIRPARNLTNRFIVWFSSECTKINWLLIEKSLLVNVILFNEFNFLIANWIVLMNAANAVLVLLHPCWLI